jgi:catechol 2,3-dioxygenase-like lactoylglutathione lyase family enzyme
MSKTTRVISVSIPVSDVDEALAFYTDVLGCELVMDVEAWPGARYVEVLPPGSSVGIVLLPHDSEIPIAVRLGTTDAQEAHDRIRASGVELHNDEVLRWEGVEPMFSFEDRDGNRLVYLEDSSDQTPGE